MIITFEVQIDTSIGDKPDISRDGLIACNHALNNFCNELENLNLGYISAEMCKNNVCIIYGDIEEME